MEALIGGGVALVLVVLIGLVWYYMGKEKSSALDAEQSALAKKAAEDRALEAELARIQRNEDRYRQAQERSKNATIDTAVRDWVDAGKLWRRD